MHPMIQRLTTNNNACELCGFKDDTPLKPAQDQVIYIHYGKHKGKYLCLKCLRESY